MSAATTSTPSKAAKAKKEREQQCFQPQQNDRLKIVIRRLPPNLPKELFWQSVQQWVTDETTTWRIFHTGKFRKKLNKENIPSRAYLAFKTQEQVALFSRGYDGHIFRDKNGVESQAVVEFAPYQKIPPEKKKVDNRNGTIEKDEDYISFLESLKAASSVEPISLDDLIASAQPPPLQKTTPLLEALKAEKTAATLGKKAVKKAQVQAQAQAAAAVQAAALHPPANNKTVPAPNPRVLQNPSAPGSSRPPRPPKTPRAVQHVKTDLLTAAPTIVTAPTATNNVKPVPAMENPIGSPPTGPSRRTRPIIGIASRQFEAALNIAGLANTASERRKREKEKAVDTLSPTSDDVGAGPSGTSPKGRRNDPLSEGQDILPKRCSTTFDGLDPEKPSPLPPPSPKKDKSKRGGRVGAASGRGSSAPVKIPSILQRTDGHRNGGPSQIVPIVMQRSAPSGSNVMLAPVIPESPVASNPAVGGSNTISRGRGRRGRGGGAGRGRVGQPSAPRGAG